MHAQQFFLKLLNYLVRILGVFWIIGGIAFIIGAFTDAENRVSNSLIGIMLLLAGLGFILVKPAKPDDVEKVRAFTKRLGKE